MAKAYASNCCMCPESAHALPLTLSYCYCRGVTVQGDDMGLGKSECAKK